MHYGKLQYVVKWLDYSLTDNVWVLANELGSAKEYLGDSHVKYLSKPLLEHMHRENHRCCSKKKKYLRVCLFFFFFLSHHCHYKLRRASFVQKEVLLQLKLEILLSSDGLHRLQFGFIKWVVGQLDNEVGNNL